MKTFKQYITESVIDLGHGLSANDGILYANIEGYNYLIDNWGMKFTQSELPNHKSQVATKVKTYFSIPLSTLRSKLTTLKTLFIDNNRKLDIEFYRFIEPKTRQEIENIFNQANEMIGMSMNDSKLLKVVPKEDLYLYPHVGKKSSYDPNNDDYNKSRHEI